MKNYFSHMLRYDNSKVEQAYDFTVHKIVVESELEKQELIKASTYIHNLRNIDTDYVAINFLAHLYLCPDLIVVESKSDKYEQQVTAKELS